MNTKRLTKLVAVALVLVMTLTTLVACPKPVDPAEFKQAEYNTTTQVMPSNWNELTYTDGNDTQILSYIGSSFFDYDYKFDGDKYLPDGSINKDAIVPGAYTTNYSAATKIEDVTSLVDAKWGYTDEHKEKGGYAWKITLRDDLKWQNGDPITAADFVYSMQQTLDPKFMNSRANTYYDTLRIKNAKGHFYSGAPIYSPVVPPYENTPDYSFDITANDVYMNVTSTGMTLFGYSFEELCVDYLGTEEALAALKVIKDAANEFGYTLITEENEDDAKALLACVLPLFSMSWDTLGEADQQALFMETLFYVSGYGDEVPWDAVGIYEVEGENAFVVCLDVSYEFVRDGELTYYSAYYMSSLPLVHRATYEACKQEPKPGATLWTSNYNSSLETTMSWGPYMLVEFEAGEHYRLEKNPNWYGWNMEQYKNQYNVTAINTRKVEEFSTQWMGFLAGEYDDSSLDTSNVAEYANSKYVSYSPGEGGMYAMQLYSNLSVLKASDNNNGILAIDEFRQAFNLAINRSDVIDKIWPGTAAPLFGLLSPQYYYDIENAPTLPDGGNYRNNPVAKAGVLRAYGYEQAADGTWSINDLTGLTLDEAYETLTGFNPTLAKEKLKEAIEILLADPEKYGYDSSKQITIVYGSSVDNDKQRFRCEYLQGVLDDLAKDTKLEGQFKLVFDASAGDKWSDAFRSGKTQIGFGYGFRGNVFNPFDVVGGFVNPDDSLNYHMYWDTSSIDMTLTMPAGDYEGAGETITMSVQNWFYCLNGLAESEGQDETYDWGAGNAPMEARIVILSALEELTLKTSRTVMLITDAGGSFLGAKFSHFHDEYNIFMGFGGLRYMVVEYTDAEWDQYVDANGGDLSTEYRKSE